MHAYPILCATKGAHCIAFSSLGSFLQWVHIKNPMPRAAAARENPLHMIWYEHLKIQCVQHSPAQHCINRRPGSYLKYREPLKS